MPTYDYRCVQCELEFEKFLSISRREEPTKEVCSTCGGEITIKPAAPLFAYDNITSRSSVKNHRVDREFRDRLIDIKKSHHGAEMNIPP